jgi:molybdenum cofactor guanylyltransferase
MNGLVLAGGQSSRMGKDKALLNYHGVPQYLWVFELLRPYCHETFINFRHPHLDVELPQLFDAKEYKEIGPIGGLLSAHQKQSTDWFVVPIDYPALKEMYIKKIMESYQNSSKSCVVFNEETNFFEPYIGIYTSDDLDVIMQQVKEGNFSLQKILKHLDITIVPFNNLTSVDTQAQYNKIKNG